MFIYILTLFLYGLSNGLPQQSYNINNREQFRTTTLKDKGLAEVVSAVENQLPEKLQEPFHVATEELNSNVQDILDAVHENITGEYEGSDLPTYVTSVSELLHNEDSPVQFIISFLPETIQAYLPASARTGTTGILVAGGLVAAAVIFITPITYFLGYLVGKYFVAPIVLPFSGRSIAGHGRSLLNDPDSMEQLTHGVMTALNTYNLLQTLNRQE